MVQSLGGLATLREKTTNIGTKAYNASIRIPNENLIYMVKPFKTNRLKSKVKYPEVRYFDKVEFAGEEECMCLTVEDEHYLTDNFIVTHNTLQALMMLAQAKCRPAVIVLPVHLIKQWQAVISTTLPQAKTQLIKTGNADFKHEENVDFFLVTYDKFKRMYTGFQDAKIKTLVGDEIHHIRNNGTDRYDAFKVMTNQVNYVVGLTGTPVFNNGVDLFNILDAINPKCLGDRNDFFQEW